ncbi:DsrE family protein [Streptomyces sp. NPDC001732]
MDAQPAHSPGADGNPVSYFLIESKGNWAGPNAGTFLRDAAALAAAGHRVRVYLVEDGVLSAAGVRTPEIDRLAEAGVEVLVDDFSAAQRALGGTKLSPHVKLAGMETVAAALAEDDCRGVWH